jgi:type I restriction-modification system, specificity subunit
MSEWPMVKLGEYCDVIMGQAPKGIDVNEDLIGLPVIAGAGDFSSIGVEVSKWTEKPTKTCIINDIILSVRATVGTYRFADRDYCLGRGVAALRAKGNLDQKYLSFVIDFYRAKLLSVARGATFLQISKADIETLMIPLPPLGEQKRIAEILGGVANAIHTVEQQVEAANQLEKSLFNQFRRQYSALCSPIKNICKVQTGATPSRKNSAYYDGGIPWVKTGEVNGGKIEETEEYITELAVQETNCRKFPIGTILVAMYGQGATRGKVGILNCAAATNQACAALIALACEDQEYIFAVLRNCYDELRNLGRGGTQPNLNLTLVKEFEIPWPEEFAREEFSQKWRELDNLRHLLHRKLSLLQELQKSLATRAFAGLL